ncbi:hypothetical protein [Streptomyces roseochromogenus]|uniref:Uncharacterized protein n=1 Tax=Streptomyces roseochromogenus subsp. oscitans DS 12.976 TaxID=1352936 RepID=V6KKM6_STRRC|nr:hypothetical protein [Streptomyces roseochromogenus]EST32720.1 hypothetical protein M878_14265 [Streptomyces roseochromogenus subsp. oscitans DS 12.976]
MFGRRGVAVALGSVMLAGSSLVWAPIGRATADEEGSVGCVGHSESRYDPPLKLLAGPTHVHADITYTCGAHGRTVPATGSFNSEAPAASCVAVSGGSGTETIRYADGGRSLIAYDSATTLRVTGVLVVIQRGRVVEGRGQGHPVRRTITGLPQELPTECLTSGLQGGSNEVQLEIEP